MAGDPEGSPTLPPPCRYAADRRVFMDKLTAATGLLTAATGLLKEAIDLLAAPTSAAAAAGHSGPDPAEAHMQTCRSVLR